MLQKYLQLLKSHPWSSNLGSAALLMTVGDLGAQIFEHRGMQQQEDELLQKEAAAEAERALADTIAHRRTQKVNFRRYGTLSPRVEEIQRKLHDEHQRQHQRHAQIKDSSSAALFQLSTWKQEIGELATDWRLEIESMDLFRTGTMVLWSVTAYTPFFMGLYRLFDRFLPAGGTSVVGVLSRTSLSFVASIPFNAAFYCYGTLVHHTTEWYELVERERNNGVGSDGGWLQASQRVPFHWEVAVDSAQLKLRTELFNTIRMGAQVWIPINLVNFSVVPPHLRPLTLQLACIFWNGYLSLAQHRDAEVEIAEVEDER